jgi:cephalosporin hydroxylase
MMIPPRPPSAAPMDRNNRELIAGSDLKIAAGNYFAAIAAKAEAGRALGIFDKWFMRATKRLLSLDQAASWEDSVTREALASPAQASSLQWDLLRLRLFLDRWRSGRFVTYDERERSRAHYMTKYGTEFGVDVLLTCQGASSCLQWHGLPLMKTVFDFAIYPQLMAELRPRSILEIGSGSGASAIWLSHLASLLCPSCHVHSVDIEPVAESHPGVTFHQGDCARPDSLFDSALPNTAPHPWLLIEDAHHNVAAVLEHFHQYLRPGDYLYVEDSEIKHADIRRFLAGRENCYRVDTKYTDVFGRNATCAMDSIFVRTND